MKKEELDNNIILYDFEDGEFVTIYVSENWWEYSDTEANNASNFGNFVYDETEQVAYIMCSSYRIEAAVIHAMRDLFGACLWVEPKLKRKRKITKPTPSVIL